MIDTVDAWHRIWSVEGQIFRVAFRRKHDAYGRDENGRRVLYEPKGTIRRMLCRRRVHRYTRNVIPPEARLSEDVANNVLTVFDLETFLRKRKDLLDRGIEKNIANLSAGRASFRRINMSAIEEISIPAL